MRTIFAFAALAAMAALGEEPGAPGTMEHRHMKPSMVVSTNVWATVSNKVDALAKKHADATAQRLQVDIAGKQDALPETENYYDIDVKASASAGYAQYADKDGDLNTITATYATKTSLAAVTNDVASFVTFWSGDDVRDTVTNYDSTVHLPSRYLEEKRQPDATHTGEWFKVVWNEMTRWNWFMDGQWASLTNHVERNLADRAWGMYDSSTGGYSPDGVLQLSQGMIQIADGMAYQKTITVGGGALWVLTANQPITLSGVTSNAFFCISDGDGSPLFEIVKGDKRIVGATAANFVMGIGNAMTITYNVESDDHPMLSVCTDMKAGDWADIAPGTPSAFAEVTWSGQSGAWVATVQPVPAERPRLFVKASYETGGNTYIKNHVAVSMDKVVIGGVEFNAKVETHAIDGVQKKIIVLE